MPHHMSNAARRALRRRLVTGWRTAGEQGGPLARQSVAGRSGWWSSGRPAVGQPGPRPPLHLPLGRRVGQGQGRRFGAPRGSTQELAAAPAAQALVARAPVATPAALLAARTRGRHRGRVAAGPPPRAAARCRVCRPGALLLAARLTLPKILAREVAYSDLLVGLRAGAVAAGAFEENSHRSKAEDAGSGDEERETARDGAATAKWPYYARRVPHDEGFLLGLMREGGVDYRSAPRPAERLLVDMLTTLLTLWFLLLPMMWFLQRQISAGSSADKRRRHMKQRVEDVHGVDEAEELVEILVAGSAMASTTWAT